MFMRFLRLFFGFVLVACGGNGGGGNPPLPDNTTTVIFEHDGLQRSALIYTPKGYDSSFALPVVLNFHGFGGRAQDHKTTVAMDHVADSAQFLLVFPQGSLLDGDFPHWNNALPSPDNKSDADDLGFVSALLAHLDTSFLIDRERVYACGYSNGGMMSYALACYLSNEIAAVASMSGCFSDTSSTCQPSHPLATLSIHGTNDGVIAYEGGDDILSQQVTLQYWAQTNNCNETPQITSIQSSSYPLEHYSYSGGDSSVVAELYKVIGGDHYWLNFSVDQKNTNWIIWEFFDQFDIYGKR